VWLCLCVEVVFVCEREESIIKDKNTCFMIMERLLCVSTTHIYMTLSLIDWPEIRAHANRCTDTCLHKHTQTVTIYVVYLVWVSWLSCCNNLFNYFLQPRKNTTGECMIELMMLSAGHGKHVTICFTCDFVFVLSYRGIKYKGGWKDWYKQKSIGQKQRTEYFHNHCIITSTLFPFTIIKQK